MGLIYILCSQIIVVMYKPSMKYHLFNLFEMNVLYSFLQMITLKMISTYKIPLNAYMIHFSIFLSWRIIYFNEQFPQNILFRLNIIMSVLVFTIFCIPILAQDQWFKNTLSVTEIETHNHQHKAWIVAEMIDSIHYLLWRNRMNMNI
jgi:hypothetical protein